MFVIGFYSLRLQRSWIETTRFGKIITFVSRTSDVLESIKSLIHDPHWNV